MLLRGKGYHKDISLRIPISTRFAGVQKVRPPDCDGRVGRLCRPRQHRKVQPEALVADLHGKLLQGSDVRVQVRKLHLNTASPGSKHLASSLLGSGDRFNLAVCCRFLWLVGLVLHGATNLFLEGVDPVAWQIESIEIGDLCRVLQVFRWRAPIPSKGILQRREVLECVVDAEVRCRRSVCAGARRARHRGRLGRGAPSSAGPRHRSGGILRHFLDLRLLLLANPLQLHSRALVLDLWQLEALIKLHLVLLRHGCQAKLYHLLSEGSLIGALVHHLGVRNHVVGHAGLPLLVKVLHRRSDGERHAAALLPL
mmetsp:Transcript_38992/g.87255  ORF Transcript_38992/g.87255 Transcript_38992/m.87255 type:complete len:311 (+) Transcript_38992:133-1065(+)